jgi:hypothetical protein
MNLASCRLASHVFCSLATPLFFSSIDSTGRKRRADLVKQATKLNEILTNYNIATSVSTSTLCCYYQALEDPTIASLMSAILCRLPHIRSFALEAVYGQRLSSFPEDFASAIRALCRSPSLTTLYLDSIGGFPFTSITGCPNLRCLRLWYIEDLEVNLIFPALFRNNLLYNNPVRQLELQGRDIKPTAVISGLLGD